MRKTKNNQSTGRQKYWYESGQLKEGLIKNQENYGNRGLAREWSIRLSREYVNGVLSGIKKQWHENGQLILDCKKLNGKLNGPLKIGIKMVS